MLRLRRSALLVCRPSTGLARRFSRGTPDDESHGGVAGDGAPARRPRPESPPRSQPKTKSSPHMPGPANTFVRLVSLARGKASRTSAARGKRKDHDGQMAAASSALANLKDIEKSLGVQGVHELDHVERGGRNQRGTRCLDRMMLSQANEPGNVQGREREGQGVGRRSRPPYDGDVEAQTAELHQQLNVLEKEIAALYEEHVPCPDEISMKEAEARKVGRRLYTLRSGDGRSAYTLRNELGAGTGACEATASEKRWGAAPSYSTVVDRFVWHARALSASYNPFKLTQIFSAAHLHGYAVVYRKQGALLHIQAQETSVVAPLAFTIGLSVNTLPPRTGRGAACAARPHAALPFEIMLYGLPAGEQRRPAHLGDLISRAISHLKDYMAIRESQGLAADVIEAHEIHDGESGHKMLVLEDVEATQGVFGSQLALAGLYYQLCQPTINPGKDADAIPSELPRLVQVYLDPSGTGGTFEGAILPDR